MEPANSIIAKLGGPGIIAKFLGIHRTRVSNWRRPRDKGGTHGLIPQRYHLQLMDFGASRFISLTAEDFMPRRENAA